MPTTLAVALVSLIAGLCIGAVAAWWITRHQVRQRLARRQALRIEQDKVLELIARGAPLEQSLRTVVNLIERAMPGVGSVMLVQDGQLRLAAHSPAMPVALAQALETLPVGEGSGVCGTAVARAREIWVPDVRTDPLTQDYHALVDALGLRACWSVPVVSAQSEVLATFAVYFLQAYAPQARDRSALRAAERLTRVALEHERAVSALLAAQTQELAERRHTAARLAGMNRALEMLSQCNAALALSEDEPTLLSQVCRVAVDIGGYRMAWVGFLSDEGTGSYVVPAAHAGHEDGYLGEIRLSTRADHPSGLGPVATALRTGKAVISQDIARDATFFWRDAALARGYRSALGLPLLLQGRVLGMLALYDAQPVAAPQDELRLLQDLASNLALGLARLRERAERTRVQAEVQRLNVELEHRVQQRTAELATANRELENFSYSLAHDLRAPLSAIDGFASALDASMGDRLRGREGHYLGRIRAGAQRMAEMIDALLSFAHLSLAPLQRETIDLGALARTELEALAEREPQRAVQWRIDDGLDAQGDARLLRLVVQNLIGNAWKFSRDAAPACIEIGRATTTPDPGVFFVRDNGVGFDMTHAGTLFGPFNRLHTEAEFPGTGLGLANCQRIIGRHGGRIWAEAAPDRGATFYFTLHDARTQTDDAV